VTEKGRIADGTARRSERNICGGSAVCRHMRIESGFISAVLWLLPDGLPHRQETAIKCLIDTAHARFSRMRLKVPTNHAPLTFLSWDNIACVDGTESQASVAGIPALLCIFYSSMHSRVHVHLSSLRCDRRNCCTECPRTVCVCGSERLVRVSLYLSYSANLEVPLHVMPHGEFA
jgi:hypothetical protein